MRDGSSNSPKKKSSHGDVWEVASKGPLMSLMMTAFWGVFRGAEDRGAALRASHATRNPLMTTTSRRHPAEATFLFRGRSACVLQGLRAL